MMKSFSRKVWIGLLVSTVISFLSLNAFSEGFDSMIEDAGKAVLEPIQINRKNGGSFSGSFDILMPSGVRMVQEVGVDGRVEVEFSWDEIESVFFPGTTILGEIVDRSDAGNSLETIEALHCFFGMQSPFFPVMQDLELEPYQLLATLYLKHQQSTAALGVIRTLKPWVDEPKLLKSIEETELLCYLMLGLNEEGIHLAKQLIESANDPAIASLAWVALAFHHLDQKAYRESWLCSVHPLLFDRRVHSPELADAYLAAMISTLRLNKVELALSYHQQFESRKLELTVKPYQGKWVDFYHQIDWVALAAQRDEIEKFADIESRIDSHTAVSESNVPILKIPLSLE